MGMLDDLFANQSPNPAMVQLGMVDPETVNVPLMDDYTGAVPVKRERTKGEAFDDGMKKYNETNPVTPATSAFPAVQNGHDVATMPHSPTQLAAPGALGMLGSEMGGPYGAVPDGTMPPAVGGPVPTSAARAVAPPAPLPTPNAADDPAAATPPAPGVTQQPQSPNTSAAAPQRATDFSSVNKGPTTGSPAEGSHDLTDVPYGMLGKAWDGIKNNSNLLMGLGAGMVGAPSWAVGASRGFAGAQAGSVADQRQNLLTTSNQQMVTALLKAGAPYAQVMAAQGNPNIQKALIDSYIGDRKNQIEKVKDSLGNERLVAVNPYMSQDDINKRLNSQGGDGQSAGGLGALGQMPIDVDPATGRDEKFAAAFKAADPVNYAATESILQGNMSGTGRNMQQLLKYAARIEPSQSDGQGGFNQSTMHARQKLYESYYGGGEGFKSLRSANTAVDHGVDLSKDIEDLHNYSTAPGFMNPVTGAIAEQFSKPYQRALAKFNLDRHVYAHELEFAVTGKSTVSGTRVIEETFDPHASPDSLRSTLQASLEKLSQRVDEHRASYNTAFGSKATKDPVKDFLTNRDKLNSVMSGEPPQSPQAAAPKPGKYIYQGPGKPMVPAQ